MSEGDLLLVPLPHADGKLKIRPVVALRSLPGFGDWLVCGVSAQLHQAVPDFDEIIRSTDSDFAKSGLKAPSLIRLSFLVAIPRDRFRGRIGAISAERHGRLLSRISNYLKPKP